MQRLKGMEEKLVTDIAHGIRGGRRTASLADRVHIGYHVSHRRSFHRHNMPTLYSPASMKWQDSISMVSERCGLHVWLRLTAAAACASSPLPLSVWWWGGVENPTLLNCHLQPSILATHPRHVPTIQSQTTPLLSISSQSRSARHTVSA